MKTKILLIGGNSALAKYIKKEFENDNFQIITAGRNNCDIYIDITEPFEIPADIDTVINFAALFASKTDDDFRNIIDTNIKGSINVCIASKNIKHLILISSIYADLSEQDAYYTDYSITKNCADKMVKYYCKLNNINLTILKPSQIYGTQSEFRRNQPLFYTIIDRIRNGEDINIYGTNNALKNYINAFDLSEIIKKVIKQSVYGEFKCLYPKNIKILDIVRIAEMVYNTKVKVNILRDKPNIVDNVFEFDDTLYKIINYYPKIDIRKGIELLKNDKDINL